MTGSGKMNNNRDMFPPGEFIIFVGPNSRDTKELKVNWF